jgi:S1-C subfamily serine protease
VIDGLLQGSPGARCGAQIGDIVVQLGSHPIATEGDLVAASFYLTADDDVTLAVTRDEQRLEFSVRPIAHPQLNRDPEARIRLPALGANDLRLETTGTDR